MHFYGTKCMNQTSIALHSREKDPANPADPMLDHQRESFPCLLIVIQYHQSQTARLFPIASNLSGCFSICHGGYFLCTTGTYFYFY